MSELSSDEVFLRGRLQVCTVLGALSHSGVNPEVQNRLQSLLDVHDLLSERQPQEDLGIYLKGETAEQQKSDIVFSLEFLCLDPSAESEQRVAAAALYTMLK